MANDSGSGFLPGDAPGFGVRYFLQQDFLDLAERILPSGYVEGLKNNGGWEFYQAMAKMFERVSLAIGRYELSQYVLSAPRGSTAKCTVEFYRTASPSSPSVTMLKGTIVKCSKSSRFFSLDDDVVMASNVLAASGEVTALAYGFEYNVPGPYTTPSGELIPGEIDAIELPLQSPPFSDPTVGVRQLTDATGGSAAALEQLAVDAGFTPDANEPSSQIRARLRQVPDIYTPEAIDRALAKYCERIGIPYTVIETWQSDYQTCWDGPDDAIGDYDPNLFCYDDPRPTPPFRNRWLSERDHLGAFFVVVPDLPSIAEYGMAYDDPALTVADYHTSLGMRAPSAYDLPESYTADPSTPYLTGVYDGDDYEKNSFYAGLYQLLQSIRSYGVVADVEVEDDYPS